MPSSKTQTFKVTVVIKSTNQKRHRSRPITDARRRYIGLLSLGKHATPQADSSVTPLPNGNNDNGVDFDFGGQDSYNNHVLIIRHRVNPGQQMDYAWSAIISDLVVVAFKRSCAFKLMREAYYGSFKRWKLSQDTQLLLGTPVSIRLHSLALGIFHASGRSNDCQVLTGFGLTDGECGWAPWRLYQNDLVHVGSESPLALGLKYF